MVDRKRKNKLYVGVGVALLLVGIPLALTLALRGLDDEIPPSNPLFFAKRYPVSSALREELRYMRDLRKIKRTDEIFIQESIRRTAKVLQIPAPLLWCLFFQESRLNHLLGLDGERPSHGLGQFTHFGFHEINHQLPRFNLLGKRAMTRLLGKDVRPISPIRENIFHTSSYYYIPTAVVTSAIFLKNRYLQLHRVLRRKGYRYDPDILWLFSVMAYNKGTRSVLNFWNHQAKTNSRKLSSLLTDKGVFFSSLNDPVDYEMSLRKIWSPARAEAYARELTVHMRNITGCSVSPLTLPTIVRLPTEESL